uniref:Uncharacterized protein n=1 Tax=Monodon monoceros TaxID=40151 RepID=A0A8C6BHJ2_MONMO
MDPRQLFQNQTRTARQRRHRVLDYQRGCKWQWIKEGTMAGAWRALVLVARLAAMACVAQCSLSYEEIVTQALWFFNQGRQGQRLFGLWKPSHHRLAWIKETNVGHRAPVLTDPQEERNCTGIFFMLQHILPSLNRPLGSEWKGLTGDHLQPHHQHHCRCLTLIPTWREGPQAGQERGPVRQVRRSAGSPGADTPGTESSQLPPAVRDLYEKAKHDIITNILRNF